MPKNNGNYAYLCNGLSCEKECALSMTPEEWAKYPCHHTTYEEDARNKCRRKRKFKMKKEHGEIKFIEVDPDENKKVV